MAARARAQGREKVHSSSETQQRQEIFTVRRTALAADASNQKRVNDPNSH
jgi:hypothetical protein